MRICFISHSGRLGGAESVLLETIEILNDYGVECRVILPAIGEFSNRLANRGIPFAILPLAWWMSSQNLTLLSRVWCAARIVRAVLVSARQVRRWNCDVVYSSTITVCTGAFVATLLRLPHVWHIQEFGLEDHGLHFAFGEGLSLKLLGHLSRYCITLSKALKLKFTAHIDPSKISVIYPSMHIAIERSVRRVAELHLSSSKIFRCVIVGQLSPGKRQEDAIQAIAALTEMKIDVELVVVGNGGSVYRRRLETMVKQNRLQKQVTFVGQVPDASPYIAKADALLMCSKSEGFGRVTIEGMLAEKPVIAARSGASVELVQDGVTGLLYSVGDPIDLALKIRELIENREYARRLGRNAKNWAGTVFTKERYITEWLAVLDSLRSRECPLALMHSARG